MLHEGNGSVVVTPEKDKYKFNETVSLEAVPDEGWKFTQWTGDHSGTNEHATIKMNQSKEIVAHFEKQKVVIAVNIVPPEGGTVMGEGIYDYDEPVTLTAMPNLPFNLEGWYRNDALVASTPVFSFNTKDYFETQEAFDLDFKVEFDPKTLEVTVVATPTGSGEVTGGGKYYWDDPVELGAVPYTGYGNGGWYNQGELISPNPVYNFNATDFLTLGVTDTTWMHKFSPLPFDVTLTVTPTDAGITTGGGTYLYGDEVTIGVTPTDGLSYEDWFVGEQLLTGEHWYTFSNEEIAQYAFSGPQAGFTALARFGLSTYQVTLSASPTEGGMVSGCGQYKKGDIVTIVAIANEPYTFTGWYTVEEYGVYLFSPEWKYSFPAMSIALVAFFVK